MYRGKKVTEPVAKVRGTEPYDTSLTGTCTARQFLKQLAAEEKPDKAYLLLFDQDGTTTTMTTPKFDVPSSEVRVSSVCRLLHGGRKYLVEIIAIDEPETIELVDQSWPSSARGKAIGKAQMADQRPSGGFIKIWPEITIEGSSPGAGLDSAGGHMPPDYLQLMGVEERVREFNQGRVQITQISSPQQRDCCTQLAIPLLLERISGLINKAVGDMKAYVDLKAEECRQKTVTEIMSRLREQQVTTRSPASPSPACPVPATPTVLPETVGVGVAKTMMKLGAYRDECEFTQDRCVIPDTVMALVEEKANQNIQIFASTLAIALYRAEELHGRAVDGSKAGKEPLSPRRLAAIKRACLDCSFVPQSHRQDRWHKCKNAINIKLRNLFNKKM